MNTSWSEISFFSSIDQILHLDSLSLPEFKIIRKLNHSDINSDLFEIEYIDFLEQIMPSDTLDYEQKFIENTSKIDDCIKKGEFDLALEYANKISSEVYKAISLSKIAAQMSKAGLNNESKRILDTSFNIAYSIISGKDRITTLCGISSILAKNNNLELAVKILKEAKDIANTNYFETEFDKNQIMSLLNSTQKVIENK